MSERQGVEEAALERIAAMIDPMVEAGASMLGMPPGAKKYTRDDELQQWNYSPIADPSQRIDTMRQLMALGKTDEEITDAIYPNRRRLIDTGRTKVKEKLAFAKEMRSLMDRKAQEQMPAMPPAEEPLPVAGAVPEPKMPSALDMPAFGG